MSRLQKQPFLPQLGAEVWLEPNMTQAQLDHWMRLLNENQMPVARIFMTLDANHSEDGLWNFGFYDQVFDAAARYGISIVATFMPCHPARTHQDNAVSLAHVAAIVTRYKDHLALDTWLLINEPSAGPCNSEIAAAPFVQWLTRRYIQVSALNAAWDSEYVSFADITDVSALLSSGFWNATRSVDVFTFWREHHAFLLQTLAEAVRQIDRIHPIHVNPHGLLGNLAQSSYDLPAWRAFLDVQGVSLHPAWHFGLLRHRDQYALGTAYICDMVRGASEPLPFWVTELQGGNNIYSGTSPMYPEANDIAQWTWTSLMCGAQRVIYWLLNARSRGVEAGEWSLLDLQSQPSERFDTAASIARVLEHNASLFSQAVPLESRITLILSLETMTLQARMASQPDAADGHLIELLGFYETLQAMGAAVQIKHLHDFDWHAPQDAAQFVILPDVSTLTEAQAADITAFIHNGNHVLATGLTGFYSPATQVWAMGRFPLEEAFGGTYQEVQYRAGEYPLHLTEPILPLSGYRFSGRILNKTGHPISYDGCHVEASATAFGDGHVTWLPSLIGTAAWHGESGPLGKMLDVIAAPQLTSLPIMFVDQSGDLLLRVMRIGDGFLTLITNGKNHAGSCRLRVPPGMRPCVLWQGVDCMIEVSDANHVRLGKRGSLLLHWTRKR